MNDKVNNFSQFVATHEDGALNEDLTEMMNDMVAELNNVVIEQGGSPSGEITVKLKLKYDSGVIKVKANIAQKPPTLDRASGLYWSTEKNELTRQNPKQPDMFRDVNAPRETKTVGETA